MVWGKRLAIDPRSVETVRRVVRVVSAIEGTLPVYVYGSSRPKRDPATHRARHIAAYVSRVSLGIRSVEVAAALRKDETTIRDSCAIVEGWRDDGTFDDYVSRIEAEVQREAAE